MTKKFKEISSMGREELEKKFMELKKELIKLNAQVSTGTVPKNPSSIRNTRRMIARILMLISQKKMEQEISAAAGKKPAKTPKRSEDKKA